MNEDARQNPSPVFRTSILERVREGMTAVDSRGEKIGRISHVKFGDPEAVTTQGAEPEPAGLVEQVKKAVLPGEAEPDVPEPKRSQLLRLGFIKIDAPGTTDLYAAGDQIADVSGDTVRLARSKEELLREV